MAHHSRMAKHPKRPRDPAQLAKLIVDIATGERSDAPIRADDAATEFARRGGQKGGKARAKKLSALQRAEIARNAANKRWGRE
jgi:hypothetical protein